MSNFYKSVRNERQMKALTGLGQEKFELLLESFSGSLKELESENYRVNRQKRNRRPGGGQKGTFFLVPIAWEHQISALRS